MFYKFFDKKTSDGTVKSEIISNQQLAKELYKVVIRKFKTQKIHSSFTNNICSPDLADVTKDFNFLLCVIDIYNKYA